MYEDTLYIGGSTLEPVRAFYINLYPIPFLSFLYIMILLFSNINVEVIMCLSIAWKTILNLIKKAYHTIKLSIFIE